MNVFGYTAISKVIVAILHIASLALVGFTIWMTSNAWWIFIILLLPNPNVTVNVTKDDVKEQ